VSGSLNYLDGGGYAVINHGDGVLSAPPVIIARSGTQELKVLARSHSNYSGQSAVNDFHYD
jgi:hypothetical protein